MSRMDGPETTTSEKEKQNTHVRPTGGAFLLAAFRFLLRTAAGTIQCRGVFLMLSPFFTLLAHVISTKTMAMDDLALFLLCLGG
jgi:hypothetical protein